MQAHHITDSEFSSQPTQVFDTPDTMPDMPNSGSNRKNQVADLGNQVKSLIEIPEESLFRTPKASEGAGGALGEAEALKRGNTVGVRDQVMDLVASQGLKVSRVVDNLLPTPNTMEHREIKTPEQIAELKQRSPGGYRNLRESVINELSLLPTPIVRDYKDGQAPSLRDGKVSVDTVGRAVMNSGEITDISWGKFEPAIRRWEALTRSAPDPTKPDGKDGAHRLSSKFTEWMMGLPDGWITDCGLSRNDELKACGNGVVPQQAELALRMLLGKE